ncbi:MAG: helix-turn-helix domain-containing protein [Oscillospiraceae bacterium]|nr:helix-turn-helix domain-containing protein [Oscillospiraceae bacterium]
MIINTRKFLQNKGLKQKAFAEMAGYTEQQFSRMMTGRDIIAWDDILKIANALEVTPNDLYGIRVTRELAVSGFRDK